MTCLRRFILMTMSHLWWKQAAMSCQHGPVRWRASMAAAEFSSHVIPTLACAAAWDLWLR